MKTTKDFDCVKMMRDIRDKMNMEIINMDPAQVLEYFNKKSEEYKKRYNRSVKQPTFKKE